MNDIALTLTVFPRERTWLLPALHAVHEAAGHLSGESLAAVAAHVRVPASEVYGVATGYPEFRLTARAPGHARVCTGVTCRLLGADDIVTALQSRNGAAVETVDCLFACSVAPVVDVDGVYHGRATPAGLPTAAPRSRSIHSAVTGQRASRGHGDDAPPPHVAAPSAAERLQQLVTAARARRGSDRRVRLLVQMGTCGRAVGAEQVHAALVAAATRRSLDVSVVEGACSGMCYAAPSVEVRTPGAPRAIVEHVSVDTVEALLDQVATPSGDFRVIGLSGVTFGDVAWRGLTPVRAHPFWKTQERVVLARAGALEPDDLDDALLHDGYAALARALDGPPEAVVSAVKAAGLQGRGGAFFPTAVKWEGCRTARGEPKYIVMNGEEGEPGIFKDRHIMEGDPHRVLEGVLLAAYAAGASRAILYVHGEAHLSAARLARAVAQAEAAGICGDTVLGTPNACRVSLRRGAGGFVLGEETALLESIEGRRAQPRTRPPFPVESGLYGKPTVINNVETLSAIPAIVQGGGAWFAGLGTAKAPGTKVFGLSGPIRHPGVIEVRNGVTLRDLLERIGGGLTEKRPMQGAVVGGPSGVVVPAALFDVPMEPRERVSPGTGGIVAIPPGASIVEVVKTLLAFNAAESCGKCTPCREGTPRLLAMIDDLRAVRTGTPARADVEARVKTLAETIQLASLCGLGQAAPLALLRALDTFPEQFT